MAPITTDKAHKRRRAEDDVRPKKKVHVKKQRYYHSSDDESDEGEGRAYDAPKLPKSAPKTASSVPKPSLKPILKKSKLEPQRQAGESEESDEEELEYRVVKNTALNMAQDSDEESANKGADGSVEAEDLQDLDDDDDDDEPALSSDEESDVGSETSMSSSQAARNKKKRNDPDAFATSITKILGSKLTSAKRADPVLSRSASAAEANRTLADEKLEQKARAQIRAEKRAALEKGRVKDVLGLQTEGANTGVILEEEKRLKKTAQRGVVKLFNAVRAAQVQAEEASRMARAEGVVGIKQKEERVNEMSKQGFLDLISSGGRPATAA
ncbi:Rrp15p [Teratosphaeria destructans]|uniref:Rrp15p n=1 Tax=Teratosphaeria destructans TaxID=418781 RepID=A0A9W7W3L0_9PEZI|nr:Rrp15p [Teratosphaeria destructans]